MAERADKGAQTAPDQQRVVRYFSHARKDSLLRTIAFNVGLVVVPCAIYYATTIQHQAEYESERSFRSLIEVQQQFDNYLSSADSLFQLATPESKQQKWDQFAESSVDKVFKPGHREPAEVFRHLEDWAQYINLVPNGKRGEHSYAPWTPPNFARFLCQKIAPSLADKKIPPQSGDAAQEAYLEVPELAPICIQLIKDLNTTKGNSSWVEQDIKTLAGEAREILERMPDQPDSWFPAKENGNTTELAAGLAGDEGSDGLLEDYAAAIMPRNGCEGSCWEQVQRWAIAKNYYAASLALPGIIAKRLRPGDLGIESSDPSAARPMVSTAPANADGRMNPSGASRFGCAPDQRENQSQLSIRSDAALLEVFPCKYLLQSKLTTKPARHTKAVADDEESDPRPWSYSFALDAAIGAPGQHDEFEQIIIATADGRTLAVVGENSLVLPHAGVAQKAITGAAPLADVKEILQWAALDSWSANKAAVALGTDAKDAPEPFTRLIANTLSSRPGRAVELRQRIGNRVYSAYVTAYHPAVPISCTRADCGEPPGVEANRSESPGAVKDKSAKAPSAGAPRRWRVDPLYFIGLKPHPAFKLATGNFDPLMAWYVALLFLGAALFLPLLRVLFLEQHDSISKLHAQSIGACALAAVAVWTIALMSVLNQQGFNSRADISTHRYADALEQQFSHDLTELLSLLNGYTPFLTTSSQLIPSLPANALAGTDSNQFHNVPLAVRFSGVELPIGCPALPDDKSEATRGWFRLRPGTFTDWHRGTQLWSPLGNSFSLSAEGRSTDKFLSAFQCPQWRKDIPLQDREYFQLLEHGHAWRWPWRLFGTHSDGEPGTRFVAQRLFNRQNGAKLLQLALPVAASSDDSFRGIVSGDSTLYALSAAIPPLHYGFAIVDISTGTVLFHSDDERSLVENFYLETENNPQLLAAIKSGTTADFSGTYRGRVHRFHYRPLQGVPWGLVVDFPLNTLHSTIVHAGGIALTTFAGVFLVCVGLAYLLSSLFHLRHGWAWPQWRLGDAYIYIAVLLVLYLAFEIVAFSSVEREGLVALIALNCLFIPATGAALLSTVRPSTDRLRSAASIGALSPIVVTTALAGVPFAGKGSCPLPYFAAYVVLAFIGVLIPFVIQHLDDERLSKRRRAGGPAANTAAGGESSPNGRLAFAMMFSFIMGFLLLTLARYCAGYSATYRSMLLIGLGALVSGMIVAARRKLSAERAVSPSASGPWKQPSPLSLFGFHNERLYALRYVGCAVLCSIVLSAVPAGALYLHALALQVEGSLRAGLLHTAETMELRTTRIDDDLHHQVISDLRRKGLFPEAWNLALWLPMPGLRSSGNTRRACLHTSILLDIPVEQALPDASTMSGTAAETCPYSVGSLPDAGATDLVFWANRYLTQHDESKALEATLPPGRHTSNPSDEAQGAPVVASYRLPTGQEVVASASLPSVSGLGLILQPEHGLPGDWPAWIPLLLAAAAFVFPVLALMQLICNRLLGLNMLDAYQEVRGSGDPERIEFSEFDKVLPGQPRLLLIDRNAYESVRSSDDPANTHAGTPLNTLKTMLSKLTASSNVQRINLTLKPLKIPPPDPKEPDSIWLLSNFDAAVVQAGQRRQILRLLEHLIANPHAAVFLTADYSPVSALSGTEEFPADSPWQLDESERARWTHVFSQLRTLHTAHLVKKDEYPEKKSGDGEHFHKIAGKIERECDLLWPKLAMIRKELYLRLQQDAGKMLSEAEVESYVLRQADTFFNLMWQNLPVAERLALFQLANGQLLNPVNREILGRLINRGIVGRQPSPRVVSHALIRFVRSAELPEVFARWQEDAESGTWQRVRTPLFLVLLLFVAWLAYTAGDAFQALAAVLASTVVFAGNLFRAFGLVRGSGGGAQ